MRIIKVFNANSRYHEPDEPPHTFFVRDNEADALVADIEAGNYGEHTSIENVEADGKYRPDKEVGFDMETERIIQKWCKGQGKCENYYLRLPRTNAQFIEYRDAVVAIIAERREIKRQLKLRD